MNYYPRHIGDYIGATAHLSMLEDGAYNRLMDWYYLDEQPIPNDKRTIYRRCRAASPEEREAVDVVLEEFFNLDADANAFRHTRIDEELAKYNEKSEKASAAAKQRWNANASRKHANASKRNATASIGHPKKQHSAMPTNNQEPITNNQKSRESAKGKRLDVEQLPDEWREFCSTQASHLDPLETFSRFRDYWIAQPGQKGVKVDWLATWRNWCRNEKPPNQQAARPMTENQKATEIYLRQRYPERYQQERKDVIEMD